MICKDEPMSLYGLGSNCDGSLGLGHNTPVDTPELIPDLCGNKLAQFITGYSFALAIDDGNRVYSWGHNSEGQLARDVTPEGVYLKPNKIAFFDNKNVSQISCGLLHTLALTAVGQVYAWGRNSFGQVGCGVTGYNNFEDFYASEYQITYNTLKVIHNEPDINEVVSRIRLDSTSNDFGDEPKQRVLKELTSLAKMRSDFVVRYYNSWLEGKHLYIQMEYCSQSLKPMLSVKGQAFGRQKGDPMNIYEYYLSCEIFRELLECVQYLHDLDPPVIHRDLKPDNILIAKDVRNGRFVKLCDFGLATVHNMASMSHSTNVGTFKYMAPEVHQSRYTCKADVYSLDFGDEPKQRVLKELTSLAKMRSDFVVRYYNSWLEGKHLYIQMEYCSQSLKPMLSVKGQVFGRQKGDPMNIYEYYLSCEIFRELLECVQYLHDLDPPVIHRDLKPDNILIAKDVRNGRFVKLCDFGLATVHDMASMSHSTNVGTFKYMAPEVHQSRYTCKADVYSLGEIGQELFDLYLW
ncbi:unnamed protein product [Oppiella nova]|uniref:Protein kinase domain-containing protein n=1 Tax=Oppiella nova TaxID=334625 RepID=A0A7R9LYR1_9ACAR|nr:unnamed protein product [Oppiella nova]CAG2168297.1 unnamed protein product [Oppiella nova]